MTGKDLYKMYTYEHLRHQVGVDEWEDIEPVDRMVWTAMADQLELKEVP